MNSQSGTKPPSRRAFLMLFRGGAANALAQLAASAVPDLAPSATQRARLRAENLAKAQAARESKPRVTETELPLAHCARCYAEFAATDNETLCPDCRAAETKHQSLLAGLDAARRESDGYD
jgi:hypothetical protein